MGWVNVLQLNVDLEGEVLFLAQTGPFSIPLVCTTKKCDVSQTMSNTHKRTHTHTHTGVQ